MWQRIKSKRPIRTRRDTTSLRVQLVIGFLLCFTIAITLTAVWYVTRMEVFTIASLDIVGGDTIAHDSIRAVIDQELVGTYYALVPKRFAYAYPEDRIRERLSAIPRIKDVILERRGVTTLVINFDEYQPYALWCEHEQAGAPCVFLDTVGYAFAPAPPLRGGAFLRHITEGKAPEERVQAFPSTDLAAIHSFADALEEGLALVVNEVIHTDENDLIFRISGGGEILTAGSADMQEIYDNLASLLSSPEFEHLEPGNFAYVDLRFGSKLFVNEGGTPEATTTLEVADTPIVEGEE